MRILTVTVARQLHADLEDLRREPGRSGWRHRRPTSGRPWRRRPAEREAEGDGEPFVQKSDLAVEAGGDTRPTERAERLVGS